MLKKSIDQMSKLIQSMQVPANFHGFSFATNLAANFGCCHFRIMPEIFSSF